MAKATRARDAAPLDVSDDPAHYNAALKWFEGRVPLTEDEFASLLDEDKEFAFTVANVAQADLVQEVFDEIKSALKDGDSLEDFKAKMVDRLEEAWGSPDGGRVETIFRTNTARAYNAGRYAAFTAPEVKEARPYWRFEAIDDDALDDICAPFADLIVPADDEFWADHTPPLHFNCRCTFVALDEDEAKEQDAGRTDEPPDQDAQEGFGDAPSEEGDDWADPGDYDKSIRGEVEDRLDRR